jgi:uncharacterized protein (DUF3820 family)
MPIPGKHVNTRLQDVPADYLLWCGAQEWCSSKYPRLHAYIVANRDALAEAKVDEAGPTTLTDDDENPIKGKHFGTKMVDVPASYLLFCADQSWCEFKYPAVLAYVDKNRECLETDAEEDQRAYREACE